MKTGRRSRKKWITRSTHRNQCLVESKGSETSRSAILGSVQRTACHHIKCCRSDLLVPEGRFTTAVKCVEPCAVKQDIVAPHMRLCVDSPPGKLKNEDELQSDLVGLSFTLYDSCVFMIFKHT